MSKIRRHTRKNLQKIRAVQRWEFELRIQEKRGQRQRKDRGRVRDRAALPIPVWEEKRRFSR